MTLLPRGEDYLITMPYAHCKGILLGTLTMELGGEVYLKCEKTGYRADLEFKLKVRSLFSLVMPSTVLVIDIGRLHDCGFQFESRRALKRSHSAWMYFAEHHKLYRNFERNSVGP